MLTYLSNKSQIIPLTMATRSSAKLLHSKSYAETQKHGGGHQYIIFYCAKIVLLLSSHLELRGVTPVQSHHFSPQGYSQEREWVEEEELK